MHPSSAIGVLLFMIAGCATSDSPRATTWSTSAAVLGASESRPAWTLRRLGGDGFDSVAAVAAMPDGGLVIAGHFEGTIELGSERLVSAGETDAFIARLDPAGQIEWAERLGGASFDAATAVLADAAGNAILVGDLSGTVRVGNTRLRARGRNDMFAVSFGPDSAIRWAVALGESDWDAAAAAALTRDGSIAVVGTSGRIDRDAESARSDDADVLVALLGPAGDLRWASTFGGREWDQGFAVAAHPGGDIVIGGSFGGRLDRGGIRLASTGVSDGFVLRLSPTGSVEGAQRIGGTGADAVTALAVWSDGKTAIAGHFTRRMSLGGTALSSGEEPHAFVARFDPDGEPTWAMDAGAGNVDALLALADGTLLLASSHSQALDLVATDPSEVMLHHIAASGQRRVLLRLSGSLVHARGLVTSADGDAVAVGSFAGRARLGPRVIEAEDNLDGFLMTTWLGAWGD